MEFLCPDKYCKDSITLIKYSFFFFSSIYVCCVNVFTWSKTCVISSTTGETKFAITDTKFNVPVVTLSTQHNIELLKELESCFKRIINWNKYQSKLREKSQNRYLDYLTDPSFQGVNRIFDSLFENRIDR